MSQSNYHMEIRKTYCPICGVDVSEMPFSKIPNHIRATHDWGDLAWTETENDPFLSNDGDDAEPDAEASIWFDFGTEGVSGD